MKDVKIAVLGGLVAQMLFEIYAWLLSPVIFGPTLEPSNLVKGLVAKYTGINLSYESAFVLHALIGIVGFAIFTLLIYKALNKRTLLSGFASGLVLWFIAQGILAPMLGREFMMGFGSYTQSSFVAHIGMTIIIAIIINTRLKIAIDEKVKLCAAAP